MSDLVGKPHQARGEELANSWIGKLDYGEVGRGDVDHGLPSM